MSKELDLEKQHAHPATSTEHPGSEHNKLLLSWHAPEFINHPKSPAWFIGAGIFVIAMIGYAIYSNSATMAIVFIVLAGVYYLTHNQKPKMIEVKITELGIYVNEKLYQYNMIKSFWITYHPPFVQSLNLELTSSASSNLTIQLNEQSPVELRAQLVKEIPEIEGRQESFGDIFTRLLRL